MEQRQLLAEREHFIDVFKKTPDEIIDNIHDEYAEEYGEPTRGL